MKRIFTLSFLVLTAVFSFGQSFVQLKDYENKSDIIINTDDRLVFVNQLSGFYLSEVKLKDNKYLKIDAPGYYPDNVIGNPELPVFSKLIEVPYNSEFEINIISFEEQIIELSEYGFDIPLLPNQPSLRKDQDPELVKFIRNENIYTNKIPYTPELVKIKNLSILRGIPIAQLIFNPFSYDIAKNTLTIRNNVKVEIIFKNTDIVRAKNIKSEKHSPAFENSYKMLWNYKVPQTKDALSSSTVKYVIVSDRMFEETLQPFIEWKTKKGFNVVTAYTDEIGTTTTAIKSYLQNLYIAGTESDPAPTYLLIVGDVAQVPSFSKSLSDETHVTDLYYCTFDGSNDYIPEMYFGRFSATNVSQLEAQINKTLVYEQYSFVDPSYLENTMFVVGYDDARSPIYGNGQTNYATTYYFNEEHDQNVSTYLHPQAMSKLTEIMGIMNNGVGYVNYTAHCSSSGWSRPDFTTQKVRTLTNSNEYFFSVGNCCQSNKFEESECFGEALLRAENSGAVAHLGGSNNTYWDEDYYWSVGLANNITSNPTYNRTGPGVYDKLFHENGEEPYTTAGQMNYSGNLSVMSSSSSLKQYYWEIYHVMGDPSLMPYIGIPKELEVKTDDFVIAGMGSLTVNTEPDAYVALSHNGKLLCAALVDESGSIDLEFEPVILPGTLDIVVTKQFRIPYIAEIEVIIQESGYDAAISSIVLPTSLLHINESAFKPTTTLLNLGTIDLTSAVIGYSIDGEKSEELNWTGDLKFLEAEAVEFNEISLADGEYEFVFYVNNPNGNEDTITTNNSKSRKIQIYSGNIFISDILSPDKTICSEDTITPEIKVTNNDKYPITSLVCSFNCGNLAHEFLWEGHIAAGESENIQFPEQNKIESGAGVISFSVSNPNGGTNIAKGTSNVDNEFYLVRTGQTVELKLKTDNYPEETSWELIDDYSSLVLFSKNSYSETLKTHTHEWCLGPGCYTFKIYDAYNDGMAWGGLGNIRIINTSTNETILNLPGNNFSNSYSQTFCIDLIECPFNKELLLDDNRIKLTGEQPKGGEYSGAGIENGYFDPYVAGIGVHTIKYGYTTLENDTLECEFEIKVADFYAVNCPENIEIDFRKERLLLSGADYEGGTYSGAGVEDNYFDPSIAGIGTHLITYTIANSANDTVECEFEIIVNDNSEIESEVSKLKARIYPNPTNGILIIKLSEENNFDIIITNILGQTVKEIKSISKETQVDMSSYPDGTYFVKIIGLEQNIIKKIIKN